MRRSAERETTEAKALRYENAWGIGEEAERSPGIEGRIMIREGNQVRSRSHKGT